ncbi:DUF551 domain-containing protein [Salmonella enterica]|nr:DUF551 domain-containing protein [Salmonella enterica]MCT7192750.1 DUF551 domain-containing protein [Salmonella enterica subsp. enterica serovar Meleagridis]
MKENQIRELVNELHDIAIEYHGTQQLRERIARTVRAAIIQAGNSPVIGVDMASEPDRSVDVRYLAPPGYVMVPKVVTPEIGNAINEVGQRCTCGNCSQRLWDLLLASAPVQVDIEMLASALKNAPLAPSDNQGRPRALVVPPAIEPDYKVIKGILPTANPHEYACCIAADMWNACRAAMLQGSQPVSDRDELPYAQVKAAADLYALCWQSGEVVTYTPDPEKATIWLNNYSGTCVQEYVKLERLQETLSGNSPVIPDDWVMVPKEPTQAMINAWLSEVADWRGHVAGYKAALAAAPKPQNVPQNIPENIPSGKSTLTPDGWISCSERMPAQDDWVLIYSKHGEYLAGQVQGEYVELNDGTLSWLGSALHWMPLPEPPQEVNRG